MTFRIAIAAVALLTAFGFQHRNGPPGYKPGPGSDSPTVRKEPAWSFSKLEVTRNDFHKVRVEMQRTYGLLTGGAFIDEGKAEAAYGAYLSTKRPVDAFRALYLWNATGGSSPPMKFEALWKVLPSDEYEVARLHFIWGAGELMNALAPMGDRLLKKDPNDIQVMHIVANLRTRVIPDRDLKKAEAYAARVLKEAPGPLSYLRYGMVKMYVAKQTKDAAAGKAARVHIEKFLTTAHPRDSWHRQQATAWLKWLTDNGY